MWFLFKYSKMNKSLLNAGLSINESKVYLAMLSLNVASVTDVSKKSGVYRSNCYDALNKLIDKGLISTVVKSNKKYYNVADPDNLIKLYDERRQILDSELPEFKKLFEFHKVKQDVQLFNGTSGIKTILKDINNYKHYDAFGISSNLGKVVPGYFPYWIIERHRKGLFARMVKTESDVLLTPQLFGVKAYKKMFDVRNLPDEHYTPTATFIYGNKVAIILESLMNPLGIIINNKEISEGYKKQFKVLWSIAKKEDLRNKKFGKPRYKL